MIGGLEPLLFAFATQGPLAQRLVWGNVASAVAAAGRLLALARPELRSETTALTHSVLSDPRLSKTGAYRPAATPLDGYRRATCCLYYQLPGAGICGDCVFSKVGD